MSFSPLMMKLVAALIDDLPSNPQVIELGNQTFDPTLGGTLSKTEDMMRPLIIDFLDRRGKPYDKARLLALSAMSPQAQKPHTASYFKALGFSSYDAIDVNSLYGSLIMDLNVDLSEVYDYRSTFDVVTNNGTGEHIFNQAAVSRTCINYAMWAVS